MEKSLSYLLRTLSLTVMIYIAFAQDLSLFGVFNSYLVEVDQRELNRIYSTCFEGLGLLYCSPRFPDDDIVRQRELPYYSNLKDVFGQNYCVQCCGNTYNHIDTWDLYCEMDVSTGKHYV